MDFTAFAAFMDALPAYTGIPGAEIMVMHEHRPVFHRVVGLRDAESGEPLRGGELYHFYSATKPITAVAAMQLVERGMLSLNDPVSLYLPEYGALKVRGEDGSLRDPVREITIGHLLSMTAGLDYNFYPPAILSLIEKTGGKCPTREAVRAYAEGATLAFDPGDAWLYGICHDVIGAVIEVVTGKLFDQYVKKNIFDPLGMHDSCFHTTDALRERMATPYRYDETTGENIRCEKNNYFELGTEFSSGGAGLISSIPDYILFVDAMANGGIGASGARILQANTVDLMREDRIARLRQAEEPWPQLAGYGYGLGVRTLLSRTEGGSLGPVGEFGWDGAKGVYLLIDTENHLALAYAEHRGSHKEVLHPRLRNLLYSSFYAETPL